MILKSIDEKTVNSNPWSQSDFYGGTLSAPPRILNAISDVGSDRVKIIYFPALVQLQGQGQTVQ